MLLGGHPGEWEGEHPLETIERFGAQRVFLAGWHEQDELPGFLSAADVFALASVHEQFGQVLIEAMAAELAVIAVDRHGSAEIVEPGRTVWLVAPDDLSAMADALVEAVNAPAERTRRGPAGRTAAERRFSWPALSRHLATALDEVIAESAARLDGAPEAT